jgi:hypothetical protein
MGRILRTAARAGVASAVHGRVQRRQQQRWAAQDQAVHPPAAAPESAPAAAPPDLGSPDRLAQLERLGDLRDRGVLTDAEFEIEKRKLLGV